MTKETEKKVLAHVKKTAPKLGLRALRISMRQGVEVGWPDNCVFGPHKNQIWIETKRPGEKPTPIQMERAREITAYGFAWAKCDSCADVEFTLYNFARYCLGQPFMDREEFDRVQPLREH